MFGSRSRSADGPVDARTSTASPAGRRCQASSVAGVTMNHGQPVQGKSRLPAASRILSTHARDDGFVAEGWRVSCCNTTMSSALKPCERQRRQASRSTATKTRSLLRGETAILIPRVGLFVRSRPRPQAAAAPP